jgi:ABC-type lipoprotein release transport system permease subunit
MGIILHLAWHNLWRNRRRTWLTATAIAFSSTLLVFMISLQLGAYDMMIDTSLHVFTGQMQIQRTGYLDKPQMRRSIPAAQALARDLRRATAIQAIAVRAQGFALVSSRTRSYGAPVVGVEPAYEERVSTLPRQVKQGRYLSGDYAQEAVLGGALARNLKVGVGDELTLLGSGRDGSVAATVLTVAGVYDSGNPELDRHLVEIPLRTFQEVFSMEDAAHAIVISGSPINALDATAARVAARMPAQQDLVLLDWPQLLPGVKQAIQADMAGNWFTYIILIVVVTFSILNTFLMAVRERTREFGIMLALGASPGRIGGLVMLESLLLTTLGLVLGVAAGLGIVLYFHRVGFTFPGMAEIYGQFGLPGVITPKISLLSVTLGPGVIFLFTITAAVYPALQIRRLHPVDAMHAV